MDVCDFRDNPRGFLDGLIANPIDVVTEDGATFVYSAVRSALGRLDEADVRGYVSKLKNAGYDVKWDFPVHRDLDTLN